MKKETRIKLRKLIERVLREETNLNNSIAYKIFKKFGLRYGSLWAMNDKQDEKVQSVYDALIDAGFKPVKDSNLRSYDSYLVKGDERVYYSARTGSPGLRAIRMVDPAPPQRPASNTPKPEFGKSNLGNLQKTIWEDLKASDLTQFTANEWRKSAEKRGTFEEVDAANNGVGITMKELWPKRFHQIMSMFVKKGKLKMNKLGGKNVYSFE